MVLSRRDAALVFLVFAFSYFFSALVRSVTATLAPTLTAQFALQASDLGLLAGGYFVGFAATQLPLGHWLDRHGPRWVLAAFLVVAILGCLAFASATSFTMLLGARVLCGIGLGACLMAPLTGFRRWLEPSVQLRANSWMLMAGSIGMVASTTPVQWLIPRVGWRPVFWGLAVLLALAVVLVISRVPRWEAAPARHAPGRYADVWRDPYFRRMAPVGAISYGGMLAMQTLWAGPWLARVTGLDAMQSAAGLFTLNLGLLATYWCWGMANPHLTARGWSADRLIVAGLPLSLIAMAYIIVAGPHAGAWAWTLFCVFSTCVSLAQPAVAMAFAPSVAGRALSAYNLVIFGGVFVMQWGIGLLIDGLGYLGLSEVDAFRGALAVFLLASIGSWVHLIRSARDNPRQ